MQKKMLIILLAVVVLIGALYFVVQTKNNKAIENSDNPYGKNDLKQETIDELDDPLYQNQITPDKLDANIKDGKSMFVYFYQTTCIHCKRVTPILVPLADDMGIDMKKFNLWEFDDMWGKYGIEGTPTLVYYKDGKEVDRVSGEQSKDMFQAFFNEYKE